MNSKRPVLRFSKHAKDEMIKMNATARALLIVRMKRWIALPDPLTIALKMQGMENIYRVRFDEYRVICEKRADEVLLVLRVAHRSEVYR